MLEYPKALYLRGWDDVTAYVTVDGAEAEAEAIATGYAPLGALPDAMEADDSAATYDDAPDAPKRRGRPPKAPQA